MLHNEGTGEERQKRDTLYNQNKVSARRDKHDYGNLCVVRALEYLCIAPTYLEFFGFTRAPFARLSGPSEVFHTEQYSLLLAHLANATERSDSIVVICGADGSGKTTLLNRYIASLSDDISFATIDENCRDAKAFYSTLLQQLGFRDITGTQKELENITREYLIYRGMAADPVPVVVDNAHLISPKVLEQLRRICATKVEDRRVLSVILAGNTDLVRIMDSPAMSQIQFRHSVDFNIRDYTAAETANYVRHHLGLAGGSNGVKFSSGAYPLIHRYTGGNPSLINMLCNAVLSEAAALQSRVITEDLVRGVADNMRLLPHVVPLTGKGRRKTDPDLGLLQPAPHTGERISARDLDDKEATEKTRPSPETPGFDVKYLIGEIRRLKQALSDSTNALQQSEKESQKLAAALENLDESTAKTDVRIADLQDELVSSSQEIVALSARNEELESRDMELTEAEADIAVLASELQEAKQKLIENQVRLAEYSTLILQLKTENELASSTLASMTVSAGEQSDAVVTSFEIVKNGVVERVVEIAESPSRFMIGRGDDSELLLNSRFVSRHHAMISCTEQRIYIEDLNSSNGTIVNFEKITRCELRPGDIVMIGDYEIWTRQALPGK